MSLGLKVFRTEASRAIKLIKEKNKIDNDKKILQEGDFVIIPLISKLENENLDIIGGNYVDCEFKERETRPSSLREALEEMLPNVDDEAYQTSFDQIGDIAVIDLKEDLIPFAQTVGEALMKSNPSIKSVFRKSSKVDGKLRVRGLEHIAGIENYDTVHKEHGVNIRVNINDAYFSPRLATEHERVAKLVKSQSLVLDMFGSLAPFGLMITKNKEATVDTLDINPNVPALIKESIKMNKLSGTVRIITEDAHKFISSSQPSVYDYIIMNHPSGAYNFLEGAIKLVKQGGKIFYYDFVEIENLEEKITKKLSLFDITIQKIHVVRQSSPSEYHVCVELLKE